MRDPFVNRTTLILASASPRRRELIAMLGLPVEIRPANVDESFDEGEPPERVAMELALRKARAVYARTAQEGAEGIIVGSDTMVVLDGQFLGKPRDPGDAARMLRSLQGNEHRVYTGIACLDSRSGREATACRSTKVKMKPLDDSAIARYVATGEPMDKAGAYAVQGRGAVFVEAIEGDYFNVVGLSLSLLADLLGGFGIAIP